jgi:hypothetical protein
MEDTPESPSAVPATKTRRRTTPARSNRTGAVRKAKPAARKSPGKTPRKRPARAAKARAGVLSKKSIEALLDGFTARAAGTRDRIAAFSEEGASAARRTLEQASASTRTAVGRLSREWKRMTPVRRAQFAAALLTALAAASAPVVRNRWKKK